MNQEIQIQESSGNVFADLGLPRPEEFQAKAALAYQINRIIEKRRLSHPEAAALLGVDLSEISALARGRLSDFSYERLIHFLNSLDYNVQIQVKHRSDFHQSPGVIVIPAEAVV